jgi:prophage maintenance system killer protein
MVELFDSSKANVSEHVKNIYDEGELRKGATVRKFRTVQIEGSRSVERDVEHYNLDMIISLGYRIKSKTATKFRIWATNVLKKYTLNGIAINQKRLDELNLMLEIVSRSEIAEVAGVSEIMKKYVGALHLLEAYDGNTLSEPDGDKESWQLTYDEARTFLDELKTNENFSDNFASERSEYLSGIVAGLYQTFDGEELYGNVQEKAANLLYQVVKDHPFFDGNKRSGAALFIYFLAKNNALRDINSNALAAITLMTALSKPNEKEQIVLLIRNFLGNVHETAL